MHMHKMPFSIVLPDVVMQGSPIIWDGSKLSFYSSFSLHQYVLHVLTEVLEDGTLSITALPWQKEVKDNFWEMLFYT